MTAILVIALVGLQNVVVASRKGRIAILSTFSRWADEDIREFIKRLEIVFLINQIADNRKFNIRISCLMGIAVNWYKLNRATVVNWNMIG